MDLDEVDARLLAELQRDARQSFRALARRLGVTTPTVSARVARLEQRGLVRGYAAVLNPEALLGASALLVVRASPRGGAALAAWLAAQPETSSVFTLADGRVAAVATFANLSEESALLERLGARAEVQGLDVARILAAPKEESRARLAGVLRAALPCDQCRKVIEGTPLRRNLDGREHWFCCATCEATFAKRHERAKSLAGRAPGAGLPVRP